MGKMLNNLGNTVPELASRIFIFIFQLVLDE